MTWSITLFLLVLFNFACCTQYELIPRPHDQMFCIDDLEMSWTFCEESSSLGMILKKTTRSEMEVVGSLALLPDEFGLMAGVVYQSYLYLILSSGHLIKVDPESLTRVSSLTFMHNQNTSVTSKLMDHSIMISERQGIRVIDLISLNVHDQTCPGNCTSQGLCNSGACVCEMGWTGDSCDQNDPVPWSLIQPERIVFFSVCGVYGFISLLCTAFMIRLHLIGRSYVQISSPMCLLALIVFFSILRITTFLTIDAFYFFVSSVLICCGYLTLWILLFLATFFWWILPPSEDSNLPPRIMYPSMATALIVVSTATIEGLLIVIITKKKVIVGGAILFLVELGLYGIYGAALWWRASRTEDDYRIEDRMKIVPSLMMLYFGMFVETGVWFVLQDFVFIKEVSGHSLGFWIAVAMGDLTLAFSAIRVSYEISQFSKFPLNPEREIMFGSDGYQRTFGEDDEQMSQNDSIKLKKKKKDARKRWFMNTILALSFLVEGILLFFLLPRYPQLEITWTLESFQLENNRITFQSSLSIDATNRAYLDLVMQPPHVVMTWNNLTLRRTDGDRKRVITSGNDDTYTFVIKQSVMGPMALQMANAIQNDNDTITLEIYGSSQSEIMGLEFQAGFVCHQTFNVTKMEAQYGTNCTSYPNIHYHDVDE
eukprot:TRINITY_DN7348_c0_g1_i1.p1 TRINITY_DN7348_c0_g1~~TRINITY_DN7348_c0_g1_i1.p1  ORF type:complete len:654 (+),score=119.56 TRINITY_DN7348_c0_g1_i1:3-1964(+)